MGDAGAGGEGGCVLCAYCIGQTWKFGRLNGMDWNGLIGLNWVEWN